MILKISFPWSFFCVSYYIIGILIASNLKIFAFLFFIFLLLNTYYSSQSPKNLILIFFGWFNTIYQDFSIEKRLKTLSESCKGSGYAIKSIYQENNHYQTEYFIDQIIDKNKKIHKIHCIISCKTKHEIPLYSPIYLQYVIFEDKKEADFSKKKHILCYGNVSFIKPKYHIQQNIFWKNISKTATYINQKKNAFLKRIYLEYPTSTLFLKILLNAPIHKSCESIYNDQKELFELWGIHHYLARSGLHIVIILTILMGILSLFNLHSSLMYIASLILLIFFSIFSWTGISYLRASFMWILIVLSRLFNLSSYNVHTWSLCTLFFLILNPFYFFNLEFQLSFGATFFLVLWFHIKRIQEKSNY